MPKPTPTLVRARYSQTAFWARSVSTQQRLTGTRVSRRVLLLPKLLTQATPKKTPRKRPRFSRDATQEAWSRLRGMGESGAVSFAR